MRFLVKLHRLLVFIILSIITIILALYSYAYFSEPIQIYNKESYMLYDINNNLIENTYGNSKWANLEDVSPYFIDAIISIEDKNFYNHNGFDYIRIIKALFQNIKKGKIVEGASTISQQYIKNAFLDFDQTWTRKYKEALLTLNLETHYTKDEILEAYINTINYGKGNYGIQNASLYYFNKLPKYLTLEESLILAGIPKNPSNNNPENNLDKAKQRALVVAKAMLLNNKLSNEEYNSLDFNNIKLNQNKKNSTLSMIKYYEDAILKELGDLKLFTNEELQSGKLKIYAALDINSQKELENNINKYIKDSDIQIASVIINPNTGGVEALTGGLNYAQSQYNRALYSKRQVGSSIKPFLYYTALENGLTSSTRFLSQATTFNLSTDKEYSPQNHGGIYANKEITMASAIAYSDNIYAVKTNLFLGSEKMLETLNKVGISGNINDVASLPLGTSEINILDYAKGYLVLASGGYERNLHFIEKITDENDNVLYEYKPSNNLLLNPNYVYILNELLTSTYNKAFIDYSSPTAMIINKKATQKYAFKSGTTNTDSWSVGYNKNKLMLIWMGYDDNKNIGSSPGVNSKNIWIDTMENIKNNEINNWYQKPDNVIGILLNAVDGNTPTNASKSFMYYYLKGTEP